MRSTAGRRFEYAVSVERELARFRLVSALVVLPASLLALFLARPLPAKVLALLGVAASVGWMVAFTRARARLRDARSSHLDVGPDGLMMTLGTSSVAIRWSDVVGVDLDEERLVVTLRVANGTKVEVPPTWEGVGLEGLHALIEGAWDDARRPPHG